MKEYTIYVYEEEVAAGGPEWSETVSKAEDLKQALKNAEDYGLSASQLHIVKYYWQSADEFSPGFENLGNATNIEEIIENEK